MNKIAVPIAKELPNRAEWVAGFMNQAIRSRSNEVNSPAAGSEKRFPWKSDYAAARCQAVLLFGRFIF
jgi:hypothetical protein